MADFTPIMTQDQLDAIIGDRLKRERDALGKKYGDYDDLQKKVGTYESKMQTMQASLEEAKKESAGHKQTMEELQEQVKGYEKSSVKMRIAHEIGLPFEMAERLRGESEEDIREDAASLAGLVHKSSHAAPPLRDPEPAAKDHKTAALRALSKDLTI